MASSSAPLEAVKPETLFFDDFSSGELVRSRWNARITGVTVNQEQHAYVDTAETVRVVRGPEAAGADQQTALLLQAHYRPGFITPEGETFDFISGRIDTREKFEFTYGSAAARIRLPDCPGLWPAFWLMGASGDWPDTGEVDIMESVGEADWTGVALHGPGYSGETPLVNKQYFLPPESDATGWHVYSVDWTPDSLTFKIDGSLLYRVTRPMVEFYGRWAFDNPKFVVLNLAVGGTYPFKTNGVTSPYYGIPVATVEAIKTGQGRVLVDWVHVTKANAEQ